MTAEAATQDHYQVLGVPPDADRFEVEAAYARLTSGCVSAFADDPVALRDAFRELDRAYSILGAPERRAEYDRSLGIERVRAPVLQPDAPWSAPDLIGRRGDRDGSFPERRRRGNFKAGCLAISFGLLAVLLVGGVWVFGQCQKAMDQGRAAADEFHRLYHASEFGSIWDNSDPELQQGLDRSDAIRRLSEAWAMLGSVKEMGFVCFTLTTPPRTLRVEYIVRFDAGEAWETYDWRFEDGKPRLLGYAVETGLEDGFPDWEMMLAPTGIRPNATSCTEDFGR